MIETPEILETTPLLIAEMPLVVPSKEIQKVMGPCLREVIQIVISQGVDINGPWLTRHKRRPTETFDFSICVPVATAISDDGRVRSGELPAALVARTVYHGSYEGLGAGWGELHAWIQAQGHTPCKNLWECYTVGPESDPDAANWRTELNQPICTKPQDETTGKGT